MRISLQSAVAAFLLVSAVIAPSQARAETETIKGCPALNDIQLYTQKGFEDYATLFPGKDGWLFRSRLDLKFRFKLTDRTKNSFTRLNDAFKHYGTDMVVVMMPTRGMVHYDQLLPPYSETYDHELAKKNYLKMLDELRGTGMTVADMSDVDTVKTYFLKDDNHWTYDATKYTAAKTAAAIKALPVYDTLEKKEFKSVVKQEPVKPPHRYVEFLNQICGTSYQGEPLPENHDTVAEGGSVSADSLFGDDSTPQVALLGTSNSTHPPPSYANFEGYLKEALGVDILNQAVSGGSLQGSIGNYMLNGTYAATKPKVIIWEMNAYYGYNRQEFLREIVPSVYGECSDEEALENIQGDVADLTSTLFENLKDKNYKGHDYYAVLKLSDKSQRNVRMHFTHADGRTDRIKFERTARNFPNNPGIFYAELSDVMEAPLDKVEFEVKQPGGGFSAKICKAPVVKSQVAQVKKPEGPTHHDRETARAQKQKNWLQKAQQKVMRIKYYAQDLPKEAENAVVEAPKLPDLGGYTLENAVAKIPASVPGNVVIDNMEGAPPLRKWAFDKRLVEFQNIQNRVQPKAVHVFSGVYTLPELVKQVNDPKILEETEDAFIMRLPVAIYPDAVLIMKDLNKPVRMSQEKGAFLATAGDVFIINSEVTGWNEKAAAPAVLDETFKSFRPFITTWDGSEIYIVNSKIRNLGYSLSKSYGLTISTNDVVQEEFEEHYGDLPPPTGWAVNSLFEGLYFGFYSYEAKNFVLLRNEYKDNIIYGIDPHDRSEHLIIANNTVTGSKKKHGIILSREVNNSFIINNVVTGNEGSGIMLDRHCVNTVIAGNYVRDNRGDGITIYESPENLIYNNTIHWNHGGGIRVRNSWDIIVHGGENSFNKDFAFIFTEDPLTGSGRDFEMDPITVRTGASISGVKLENNNGIAKAGGLDYIRFSKIDMSNASAQKTLMAGDLTNFDDDIKEMIKKGPVSIEIRSRDNNHPVIDSNLTD